MHDVVIVDYGIGNVLSVRRAFEYAGSSVELSGSPERVRNAKALVLPGVGAFGDAMKELENRNLVDSIREFAQTGRPFLGICLGMQMMVDWSEEFGLHKGLGLIAGKVVKIPDTDTKGNKHKIPHIGWTSLQAIGERDVFGMGILRGIRPNAKFYFVHSYTSVLDHEEYRLADAFYGGRRVAAIIKQGNVYGCQFHPEKSGAAGLQMLENFIDLS